MAILRLVVIVLQTGVGRQTGNINGVITSFVVREMVSPRRATGLTFFTLRQLQFQGSMSATTGE